MKVILLEICHAQELVLKGRFSEFDCNQIKDVCIGNGVVWFGLVSLVSSIDRQY